MAIGEMSHGTFEPVVKQKVSGSTKALRIAAADAAIVFALTVVGSFPLAAVPSFWNCPSACSCVNPY
jgi:hypothetical protein